MNSEKKYFLGCPVWACDGWKGKLFPPTSKRSEWLKRYSHVFNSVEGNTTFYALPPIETVQKWAAETSESFRFCLKFPKTISHDRRLVGCRLELDKFMERLIILDDANRLGPSFLQLPPDFGEREFLSLQSFVHDLPANLPFAIEVRHADFFQGAMQGKLRDLLQKYEIDRVIFDARALFHFPPADLSESEARRRKPLVKVSKEAIGQFPFLRLIGINRVEKLGPWIEEWATQVAVWIEEQKTPFVFTHTPNDEFAPDFAREFHRQVQKRLPDLPDLPDNDFSIPTQMNLFG